jgi:hypothetical protein
MEQISRIKNIKLSHVPYKGTAESLQAEPVYMSSARYQQFAAESTKREKERLDAIGFVREK